MRKRHAHYREWEDFKAGLYSRRKHTPDDVSASASVLGNGQRCLDSMRRVVLEWPISSREQLGDMGHNRLAWLGQAACCIEVGSNEWATREAWWTLTEVQQDTANAIAETVIMQWELGLLNQGALFDA